MKNISIKKVLYTNKTHKIEKINHSRLVVLGLGSNIGNRKLNIELASHAIPLTNKICSSFYESDALLPPKYYLHWNKKYLNTILCGYCNIKPIEFLNIIKKIEFFLGRKKSDKWAPRIIDIDIISYKMLKINKTKLTIPHKEAKNREFVLLPMQELLDTYNGL